MLFNFMSGLGSSLLSLRLRGCFVLVVVLVAVGGLPSGSAEGGGPNFELAGTQDSPGGVWDILPDGRIITVVGDDILLEVSPQSGRYDLVGMLPAGLMAPWGASFLAVSPHGAQVMIGDNNFDGAFVYLVQTVDLTGGLLEPRRFLQENFSAVWRDEENIVISYGNPATFLGEVAVLNINAEIAIPILTIGGASGGVVFDERGNLLAANGFDFVGEGSETGDVRAFKGEEIDAVLRGEAEMIDFDTEGVFVLNALSGSPLHFDEDGSLFIGGGRADEGDFFALADGGAVADAVAGFDAVRKDEMFGADPVADADSIYGGRFNFATSEWVVDGGDGLLYRYALVTCLDLAVDQMVAGEVSTFRIREGTPGERVGLVFGLARGTTKVAGGPAICATFGIRGITRKRLLGSVDLRFDADGNAEVVLRIPLRARGVQVFLQAAEAGTCPDECGSKVLAVRVE